MRMKKAYRSESTRRRSFESLAQAVAEALICGLSVKKCKEAIGEGVFLYARRKMEALDGEPPEYFEAD